MRGESLISIIIILYNSKCSAFNKKSDKVSKEIRKYDPLTEKKKKSIKTISEEVQTLDSDKNIKSKI